MQKAFDEILEGLRKVPTEYRHKEYNNAIWDVIKFINRFAEGYNNGWILVNERLPEEHDSIFAKYKGTKQWNGCMFEKISDVVNVTVSDEKGNGTTTYAHTVDGRWSCDLLKANKQYQITAWKPLPEPYNPEHKDHINPDNMTLTPEQLQEVDELYLEKCQEVNELKKRLSKYETMAAVEGDK